MWKAGRSTRSTESSSAQRADGAVVSLDRRGRLVVCPTAEIFHAVPVEILDPQASDDDLGAAVCAALDTTVDPETAREAYRAELLRLGLTLGELDSQPRASVFPHEKRLLVVGWDAKGFPTGEEERLRMNVAPEELGRAVRRLLGGHEPVAGPVGAPFAYKVAWIACRGSEPSAVAAALGVERSAEASWEDGVERAHAGGVFVSPKTGGWVFALHQGWHDEPPDLAGLSRTLDAEVQHFATHRVVEAHAWTRAEAGRVTRAVRVVGETGEESEFGERTDAEQGLELEDVDEETVLAIAGAWSVDPRTLGRVPSESETGIFGFLPQR